MATWTFDQFIDLLQYETKTQIRSPKHLQNDEEKLIFKGNMLIRRSETFTDIKIIHFLKRYCEMEIHGTAEEMLEYFKRIDRIEQNEFRDPSSFPKYTDVSGDIICVSNSDAIRYIRSSWGKKIREFMNFEKKNDEERVIQYIWHIMGLSELPNNKQHKMITDDSWKHIYEKLCDVCNIEKLGYVEEDAENQENEAVEKWLDEFKKQKSDWYAYLASIIESRNGLKKTYDVVTNFRNAVKSLQDELKFLVEPIQQVSPNYKPVVRRFKGANYEFYLAKEVSNAFPDENVIVENGNELLYRRVFIVDSQTFDGTIAKYGADSVIIVEIPIETNSRNNTYPICSSYGSLCRPVWEEIEEKLYDIIVYRKHFMTSDKNVLKTYDLIEQSEFSDFIEYPRMYLRTNVVSDTYRRSYEIKLVETANKSAIHIPYQRVYPKLQVIEIIKKLVENHYIEDKEIKGIIDKVFEVMPYEFLNYKQMHDLYYQVILRNIIKLCPKIAKLRENQGKYKKNRESDLIYNVVENFYASKNKKNFDCETKKMEDLQNEITVMKRREQKYHEEVGRLKEQLEKSETNQLDEIRKLKVQFEKREANHLEENRKLRENQEKYEKQQQDLMRAFSELKNRLQKNQNDLIDSISSNLNNLSVTYPNSREIQKAKRDLEKFEENFNVFE